MAQPNTIIDAPVGETVVVGSQTITLNLAAGGTLAGVTLESLRMRYGMRELDSNDASGKPYKSAYVATKGTGDGVIQLKTSTMVVSRGDYFSYTWQGVTKNALIIEVEDSFDQNGIVKVPFSAREKLN
jgi:hypothetical protein